MAIPMHHPVTGGTLRATTENQAAAYETRGWVRGAKPANADIAPADATIADGPHEAATAYDGPPDDAPDSTDDED